ncbi:MAG: glucuronate isomerase [Oscillospiraceae bacterium]|jgi:glucuronate isomerase|nr:glucuronate isomerase [Oscillospiraceae bacterium]
MKQFMDKDFLLENESAKVLYHDYAASMPIIDYHCHLDAKEIYENKRFVDITEAWLSGDHYKWRLMRANGINERYITGNASSWEKFLAYATMLPRAIGNPVYHWTHLELQRYFDCYEVLNENTAEKIYELCNNKLKDDDTLSACGIMTKSNVEVVVTTDDPIDDLKWHKKIIKNADCNTRVYPCFRPDAILNINNEHYTTYIKKLGEVAGVKIKSFEDLKTALVNRIEYFNTNGCRTSDHGFNDIPFSALSEKKIEKIFNKAINKEILSESDINAYQSAVLLFCATHYKRLNWVMQLHYGVLRNVNDTMFKQVGVNTGFDTIGSNVGITALAKLLNSMNIKNSLPSTIIFPINPINNRAVSILAGTFPGVGIKSKIQQGSAWWFNDTFYGMEQQIKCFAESGLLANFVGMLTDSRSFLSYTRHEYFRRILCNIVGNWINDGKYPNDIKEVGKMIQDISYYNAKEFFNYNEIK